MDLGTRSWRRWRWTLIGLGLILLVGTLLMGRPALFSHVPSPSSVPPEVAFLSIPPKIVDLPLRSHLFGRQAAEEISRLHRGTFPLTGATIATYADSATIVWVGAAENVAGANKLIFQMTQSIAWSNTPFTPVGERHLRGIDVYELNGMDQIHYYFQVSDRIYWLAVASDEAEQGLQDLLDFALETD